MQKPIQRVKFTKAFARHTKIRDQNPSLGYVCPGEPHQRNPNAPKFEDRSQEETKWQEQGAREPSVEASQKCVKIKGEKQSNISSHLRKIGACLASTLKPEEGEFVVDSGASARQSAAERNRTPSSALPTAAPPSAASDRTARDTRDGDEILGTSITCSARD